MGEQCFNFGHENAASDRKWALILPCIHEVQRITQMEHVLQTTTSSLLSGNFFNQVNFLKDYELPLSFWYWCNNFCDTMCSWFCIMGVNCWNSGKATVTGTDRVHWTVWNDRGEQAKYCNKSLLCPICTSLTWNNNEFNVTMNEKHNFQIFTYKAKPTFNGSMKLPMAPFENHGDKIKNVSPRLKPAIHSYT